MTIITQPNDGEFPSYAVAYISKVHGELTTRQLWNNFEEVKKFVSSLPNDKLLYRYAEGKWTIKEILVHVIDSERVFSYRALCFARKDATTLPGFEQDDYVKYSNANERDITNILDEYEAVRKATITLFNGLGAAAFERKGTANNNPYSVRGLAYMIAGHEIHHFNIIKEKYVSVPAKSSL